MANAVTLALQVNSNANQAAGDMDQLAGSTSRGARAMEKATRAAKATAAGLVVIGTAAFKQASALEQSAGAVESVFGKAAGEVQKLAKAAAQSVGLAQSEYNDLAAVLGAQLRNLGIDQGKLVGTTDTLIKTGADLAATFGGTTSEAVEALSSLLRGETDPIERYGVSLKQAAIDAEVAARGQDKLTGAAKTQAETQAKLALVAKQAGPALGAFAREANTAAGQQQRATAELKNAGATLGQLLLPIVSAVAKQLGAVSSAASEHPRLFKGIAIAVTGLVAAVFAINAGMKVYIALSKLAPIVTKAWTIAQAAFNLVMSANPVALVVLGVVALVAIIVVAYKRSETFRRIVDAAMAAVRAAVLKVVQGVRVLVAWVREHGPRAWRIFKTIAFAQINLILAIVRRLRDFGVAAFRFISERARAHWRLISSGATTLYRLVSSTIGRLREFVTDRFNAIRDNATAAWRLIRSVVGTQVETIRRGVGRLVTSVRGYATSIKDLLVNAFKAAVSPVQDLIDLVEGLLDKIGKIKLPKLDLGDLNPLGKSSLDLPLLGRVGPAAAADAPISIVVNGFVGDNDQLARVITKAVNDANRRRGVS